MKTKTDETKKYIQSLDPTKASQKSDMSTNILREDSVIFAKYICDDITASIQSWKFHVCFKKAGIVSVHKKMSKLSKENYKPISILWNISKVYERCWNDQMPSYFEDIFTKYRCGFHKGYSAQHCLLVMIEKWKKTCVNYGCLFRALVTDFDWLWRLWLHSVRLIIAKLETWFPNWFPHGHIKSCLELSV